MHLSPLHRTFLPSLFQAFSVRIDFAGRPSGKTVLAAFLQRPIVFPWRLQHSCKGQLYFRGACSIPAKANRISVALAELLQRPTDSPWRLQNSCKCQNGENGICRTPANVKTEKMAFAGLLQTSKRRKWRLQNFCKRQNGENGICRTSANVKMGKMVLAETLHREPIYLNGRVLPVM